MPPAPRRKPWCNECPWKTRKAIPEVAPLIGQSVWRVGTSSIPYLSAPAREEDEWLGTRGSQEEVWLQSGKSSADCQEEGVEALWSRSQRWWVSENGVGGGGWRSYKTGGDPRTNGLTTWLTGLDLGPWPMEMQSDQTVCPYGRIRLMNWMLFGSEIIRFVNQQRCFELALKTREGQLVSSSETTWGFFQTKDQQKLGSSANVLSFVTVIKGRHITVLITFKLYDFLRDLSEEVFMRWFSIVSSSIVNLLWQVQDSNSTTPVLWVNTLSNYTMAPLTVPTFVRTRWIKNQWITPSWFWWNEERRRWEFTRVCRVMNRWKRHLRKKHSPSWRLKRPFFTPPIQVSPSMTHSFAYVFPLLPHTGSYISAHIGMAQGSVSSFLQSYDPFEKLIQILS